MEEHKIYRVADFELVEPYTLHVVFDDGVERVIDFRGVLAGPMYGAWRDEGMSRRVEIDPETHTLVWPNGADFDPETLHDWPKYEGEMKRMAARWKREAEVMME